MLLGAAVPTPEPSGARHRVLTVDCAAWDRPLGPLLELRSELDRLIETTRTPLVGTSPLWDTHADEPWSHIAQMINRLQRQLDCPLLVVIQAIDAADVETLRLLEGLVAGPMKLLAAMVLQSDTAELTGPAKRLVELVVSTHGAVALMTVAGEPVPAVAPSASFELGTLGVEVQRVLRAAAVVGDTFEAELVAGLLGLDVITTLELLQLALDQGVELVDRGSGIFVMPGALGASLRARTTPSLAAAWNAELAAMMQMRRELAEEDKETAPEASVAAAPVREREVERRPIQTLAERWHGRDLASRAAEHAEAAGAQPAAALRYLEAAEEAVSIGGHARAVELTDRALRLTSATPVTDEERQLRLRVMLTRGRVFTRAAGALADVGLPQALAVLEEAKRLTASQDPPELRAEVYAQIARVAYEIGDGPHFALALDALEAAQHILLDAGQPLAAAKLLNEAAAVHVRLGELGRAAELLSRSRDVFIRYADSSVDARRELAETNHLVARLPLHGPTAGHEEELAFAMECARGAERTYAELADVREQARVHETLGRLARLTGRPEEARALLRQAFQQQRRLGDAVGLARTTAALAELLADAGQANDALAILGDSISLNLQLGSRRGVAYNLQGLDELERTLTAKDQDVAAAIQNLRGDLQRTAEAIGAHPH